MTDVNVVFLISIFIVAIGYLIINNLIGSFLEPKIMGKDLGLSTFIVFTSISYHLFVYPKQSGSI